MNDLKLSSISSLTWWTARTGQHGAHANVRARQKKRGCRETGRGGRRSGRGRGGGERVVLRQRGKLRERREMCVCMCVRERAERESTDREREREADSNFVRVFPHVENKKDHYKKHRRSVFSVICFCLASRL